MYRASLFLGRAEIFPSTTIIFLAEHWNLLALKRAQALGKLLGGATQVMDFSLTSRALLEGLPHAAIIIFDQSPMLRDYLLRPALHRHRLVSANLTGAHPKLSYARLSATTKPLQVCHLHSRALCSQGPGSDLIWSAMALRLWIRQKETHSLNEILGWGFKELGQMRQEAPSVAAFDHIVAPFITSPLARERLINPIKSIFETFSKPAGMSHVDVGYDGQNYGIFMRVESVHLDLTRLSQLEMQNGLGALNIVLSRDALAMIAIIPGSFVHTRTGSANAFLLSVTPEQNLAHDDQKNITAKAI